MTSCRWVDSTSPRILNRRHLDPCLCDGEFGCAPCPEAHCGVCGTRHAASTCPECLEAVRSDLSAIHDMCGALPEEAILKGVDSEAMMLLGPSTDPEAWRNRAMSAMVGRVPAEYLEDCRDEQHPLWVLGTWEQIWRDHLDHHTEQTITVESAWKYLDLQIGYMADQHEPDFPQFAKEVRGCRSHLENVIHDGVRVEHGVPCSACGRNLTRTSAAAVTCTHRRRAAQMAGDLDSTVMLKQILLAYPEEAADHAKCDQGGLVEHYECRPCARTYSEAEYWLAVRARIEEQAS